MPGSRAPLASRWFVGVALLAAAYWMVDLVLLRAGVPHPLDDTWEDGVVARLLLEGEWFRSHTIYPPLWELRDPRTLSVPVLVHGPLMPALLALPIRMAGTGAIDHAAWLGAIFALLTLAPLFRLAARHFGEPVAAAAALLHTLSPLTVAAVNHYPSMLVGAFLLAASLDLLAREEPRARLAGITAGLGYLVRPEMLLAAPVLAFLAAGGRIRSRAPWEFLGVFAACGSWWWWHHGRVTGAPFFNLSSYLLVMFSPAHPGDALVRDFAATPDRFPTILAQSLPRLDEKWAYFFPRAVKRVLTTPTGATGWLVPVGVVVALLRRETRRFAAAALLLAAIPIAAMTLLTSIRLYPVPFLALYGIGAGLGAKFLFERLPHWAHRPRAWIGALAMVTVPSAVMALRFEFDEARAIERWLANDRAGLAAVVRTSENARRPMFSDTPDFVAWTTGRPTLWLMREEYERVFARGARVPPGLPSRPEPADTWFHRGNPRDPHDQRGGPLTE